ncbi:hypothetical protein U9R90_06285 [Streptomyces sp. E11-3]|uniref:hypothetical protein n=1 Tax=Streptomyces sp. E11-3 TaxID=3110112 RepID=UPI00397FC2AD
MATTHEPEHVDPGAATEELREALTRAGIVLPSLRVDYASPGLGLVILGSARPDVVQKLAEAIRQGSRDRHG